MQINRRETSKVAHYARDNSLFFNCLVPVARLRPWKIAMCVNDEQAPLSFNSSKEKNVKMFVLELV